MKEMQKMLDFAKRHDIQDTGCLPVVFNGIAHARGLTMDSMLDVLLRKPDLDDFVAQMVRAYPSSGQ